MLPPPLPPISESYPLSGKPYRGGELIRLVHKERDKKKVDTICVHFLFLDLHFQIELIVFFVRESSPKSFPTSFYVLDLSENKNKNN